MLFFYHIIILIRATDSGERSELKFWTNTLYPFVFKYSVWIVDYIYIWSSQEHRHIHNNNWQVQFFVMRCLFHIYGRDLLCQYWNVNTIVSYPIGISLQRSQHCDEERLLQQGNHGADHRLQPSQSAKVVRWVSGGGGWGRSEEAKSILLS